MAQKEGNILVMYLCVHGRVLVELCRIRNVQGKELGSG